MNQIIIITGISGSGKSTALNAFEDLDFYAVDNLPIKLLEKFLELIPANSHGIHKVALVMDLRDQDFQTHFQEIFPRLQKLYPELEILFLYANEEILIQRFSETRRKHPLSGKNVAEGIQKEVELLGPLKELASNSLDTSKMDVHQLKKRISDQYGSPDTQRLQIRFVSFGFKHGLPKNCDIVLDVRFLSNPHFVSELRPQSGLDKAVQEYIEKDSRFSEFIERSVDYLNFLIPQYAAEGKRYLSIGIGCTGGKHRSVYVADTLAERLSALKIPCQVEHQDLALSQERLAGLPH